MLPNSSTLDWISVCKILKKTCQQILIQFSQKFTHLESCASALEERMNQNAENINSVKEERTLTSSRFRQIEEELERQQRYSRRSNVIVYGMKEYHVESHDTCMKRVIHTLQRHFPRKSWREEDFERAHRLGTKSPTDDRPRPIIIQFQKWSDAMSVMRDRDGKNRMRTDDGLRSGADLTKQQNSETQNSERFNAYWPWATIQNIGRRDRKSVV